MLTANICVDATVGRLPYYLESRRIRHFLCKIELIFHKKNLTKWVSSRTSTLLIFLSGEWTRPAVCCVLRVCHIPIEKFGEE